MTAGRIEKELKSFGLETKRVDGTGVYSEIHGRSGGKTIILRTDIDALPVEETNGCSFKSKKIGVMHACGHDSQAAALLLDARILSLKKKPIPGCCETLFPAG